MKRASSNTARSIFATILVPMIALLLAELVLFVGALTASGTLDRLNQNDRDIMSKQVLNRKEFLENYLVGTVGDLETLAATINTSAMALAENGSLNLGALDAGTAEGTELLRNAFGPMVRTLRSKDVSGVYVVLNTHSLREGHEQGNLGRKPGVHIRDMDPEATPSSRNEDLLIENAPSEIVQAFQITTDVNWKPMFDFTSRLNSQGYDFLYLPFQTAYEAEDKKDARQFAYWGSFPETSVAAHSSYGLSYSMPLIMNDGTVYGVVGVELAPDYLEKLMPSDELLSTGGASYVLARFDDVSGGNAHPDTIDAWPVVVSSKVPVPDAAGDTPLTLRRTSANGYEYASSNGVYFVGCDIFKLYDSNAPFEGRKWVLLGMVPVTQLHQFTNQVRWMIAVAALLMFGVGVLGSFIVARSISNPVKDLSSEVAQLKKKHASELTLSATGIDEVDNLTRAISKLSSDVALMHSREQDRIARERDVDLLTGLLNNRSFKREAARIFSTPDLLKNAAMLMIDLDNLKDVNDTYGHDAGDDYICVAAGAMVRSVPAQKSLVARVSGDEFYILFYGFDSREEIEQAVEELRQEFTKATFVAPDKSKRSVDASGGVALYLEDGQEFDELMKLADFTMYQVKAAGKNNIAYFDMDSYRLQTSVMQARQDLNTLLDNYQLADYHFQPIVSAEDGSAYAYESLMRVSMEMLKNPGDVLELARQEKRLLDVERMTWQRTFECYRSLLDEGAVSPDAYLFINSFANLALDADELAEMSRHDADIMSHVVIEITEADNMDEDAIEVKRSIPGFTQYFALDDYGSGYNSEIRLLDLRPQFVKVDITIIRGIDTSADKQRIVSNIVEYAHERGMKVIAEGIETSAELGMLLDLDVDLFQGYYLARPAKTPPQTAPAARDQILEYRRTGSTGV